MFKQKCFDLLHKWTDFNIAKLLKHPYQGVAKMTWADACKRAQDPDVIEVLNKKYNLLIAQFVEDLTALYQTQGKYPRQIRKLIQLKKQELERYTLEYYVDAFKSAYKRGLGNVLGQLVIAATYDDSGFIDIFSQAMFDFKESLKAATVVEQVSLNSFIPANIKRLAKTLTQRKISKGRFTNEDRHGAKYQPLWMGATKRRMDRAEKDRKKRREAKLWEMRNSRSEIIEEFPPLDRQGARYFSPDE